MPKAGCAAPVDDDEYDDDVLGWEVAGKGGC